LIDLAVQDLATSLRIQKILYAHPEKDDYFGGRLRDVQGLALTISDEDQRLCLVHVLVVQDLLQVANLLHNIDALVILSVLLLILIVDAHDLLVVLILLHVLCILDLATVVDLLDSPQILHLLLGVREQQLDLVARVHEEVLVDFVFLDFVVVVVDPSHLRYDAAAVPNLLEQVGVLPWKLLLFRNGCAFIVILSLNVDLDEDEHVGDEEVVDLAVLLQLVLGLDVVQELHLAVQVRALLAVEVQPRLIEHRGFEALRDGVVVYLEDPEPAELLPIHDVLLNAEVLIVQELVLRFVLVGLAQRLGPKLVGERDVVLFQARVILFLPCLLEALA
jgi:hypothetical protein